LADEIESYREERRLPDIVDSGLSKVIVRARVFSEALDAIHRPVSMDQHDYDHSFTDEAWQQLQDDSEKAEADARALAEELTAVIKALRALFEAELKILRDRSAAVDRKLIAG
jgi:hypothetical protein